MKRFTAVLAVSIVLLAAGLAQAAITQIRVLEGDYVKMSLGTYYTQNGETGGEFGMEVWDSVMTLKGTFFTFCADPTTLMSTGITYEVAAVSESNHLGYTLSDYGKWIYYQYALNDYDDGNGVLDSFIPGHISSPDFTTAIAGAIQEGIWLNLTISGDNNFTTDTPADGQYPSGWNRNAYSAVCGDWVAAYQSGTTSGFETYKDKIGIAQLTLGDGTGNFQNQMVFTVAGNGNTTPIVPEPATMLVWALLGISAVLIGWMRRRRAR